MIFKSTIKKVGRQTCDWMVQKDDREETKKVRASTDYSIEENLERVYNQ